MEANCMELAKQTASVVSSPLQNLQLVSDSSVQNTKIGLLGCLNPDTYNQKEMFYLSPTSFRIRLVDSNKTINPPALINPSYPNSYEMIFFDRGSDNLNPDGWVNLFNINARALLNVSTNTPWVVTWDFDGSYGVQTATIKGLSFARETVIGADGNIKEFGKWRICSAPAFGTIRVTFLNKDNNHLNNLGWAYHEFMTGTGINSVDYPDAVSAIKALVNANATNNIFNVSSSGGVDTIKLRSDWKNSYSSFPGLEVFIGV